MLRRWLLFAVTVTVIGAQTHAPRRGSAARSAQPKPPEIDAADIANPNQPQLALNDKGSGVVRAQILLARAHFSCGQIDGVFGSNLQKALAAFQSDRGIPATGMLDAPSWTALNADQAPLLFSYTISDGDLKGPFVQAPADLMQQATLPYLGYASPLDALAERFHASQDLLKQLNPGVDFTKPNQELQAPNVLVMPPAVAAKPHDPPNTVVISKSESSVRVYGPGNKLVAFYVATIGSSHDPLPIGEWKINGVKLNPIFHYNAELFWNAPDKSEKAEIKPGPRNPVGLVWIELSKEHYGIHGTPDPSMIGHTTSHGCVRLTNWDAMELASLVRPGTPAILQE